MKISKKKLQRMQNLSHAKGYIAAAAMDQRGSLQKAIGAGKGIEKTDVTHAMMSEFKAAVTKVLTPHASAILLDPEFGLEAAKLRAPGTGLLLSYEKSGYDQTGPGRMPTLLPGYSAQKIADLGADAVKILLYYTPFDDAAINDKKHEWVAAIGDECEKAEIPFFLEFVGYDAQERGEKTLDYARSKPEIVAKSMEEFSKDQYKVDVLKVEIPVNAAFVEGTQANETGEVAYSKAEALDLYRKTADVTTKPFIYLSAGVSDAVFRESLELAIEAGVPFNGVLCGRATWKEGIPVYCKEGVAALEAWLSDRGVRNIQALNAVLEQGAKPWVNAYGGQDKLEIV